MNHSNTECPKIRLDKWLWAARFYKTRSLAVKAIGQGKIRVDKQKATPARQVQLGMQITIENPLYEQTVVVKDISDKRQSAQIAQTLYEETPESLTKKQVAQEGRRKQRYMIASAPNPHAKPMKHDRKKMRAIKRQKED